MKRIAASRPAGDRLCRRRRVFDADGRVPDRCPPAIADHRGGEQQQFALRTALAHDGPALVDVDVGPHEPPQPGKIGYAQAKGFAQTWLRDQPHKAASPARWSKDRISQLRS